MAVKKFLQKAEEIQRAERRRKEEPRKHEEGHDEGNWLISYADMMTLLCGFFVMLFSMAKMDEPKYEKVKEAMSKQFGGEYVAPPSKNMARFVTQLIQETGLEKEATVRYDSTGVVVAFESNLFFDTLSAELRPQGQVLLSKLIATVAVQQDQEKKKYKIVAEGHTDSRPVLSGPFATNWELSAARSARIVRSFLEFQPVSPEGPQDLMQLRHQKGTVPFSPENMTAIAYADTRPVAPSKLPDGNWDDVALAKNRRVVIRILEPKIDSIPLPEVEPTEVYGPVPANSGQAFGPPPPPPAPATATAQATASGPVATPPVATDHQNPGPHSGH